MSGLNHAFLGASLASNAIHEKLYKGLSGYIVYIKINFKNMAINA